MLYDKSMTLIDKDLDLVKLNKRVRNMNILMKSKLLDDEDKYQIAHNVKNIINLESSEDQEQEHSHDHDHHHHQEHSKHSLNGLSDGPSHSNNHLNLEEKLQKISQDLQETIMTPKSQLHLAAICNIIQRRHEGMSPQMNANSKVIESIEIEDS